MADPLGTLAIAGILVGSVIAAAAFLALLARLGDPALRTRALGFVYVGLSAVAGSAGLLVIARIADGRISLVAGSVPILPLGLTAVGLRIAASRNFRVSRSYASD